MKKTAIKIYKTRIIAVFFINIILLIEISSVFYGTNILVLSIYRFVL